MKKSMARVRAAEKGEATYVPESPCAQGHLLRSTSGGSCIECRRKAEKARYYKEPEKTKICTAKKYHANAEAIRARRRADYAANRDAEKAVARLRSAEWREKNPNHEGVKAAKARYKAANPGKVRADTVKRRAAKIHRTPAWLTVDDLWLIEQAYELAALRTKLFGFSWHVDHILPLQGKQVSGLHVPANLQVIPWVDNVRKANRFEVAA
jgi:hypothetical protein